MAAYKGSTGLEYTRTVDEAEEQKQRVAASIDRTYSIASGVFVLGLIAVGALCCISVLNNAPKLAIGCEIVVFLCLIVLLVLIGRAKRRISEQRRHNERFPYKSVNKKEIDNIFDLIADEEKKRERLDRFAMSGGSAARKPVADEKPLNIISMDRSEPESKPSKPANEPVKTSEPEEDSGIIHIFPEEEEMVSVLDDEINDVELMLRADVENEEAQKKEEASENKEPEQKEAEQEPEQETERSEEAPRKKRPRSPDGSRPPQSGKRPPQGQGQKGKKRPPADGSERDYRDPRAPRDPRAQQRGGAPQGAKKRRPPAYDPYYGGGAYYYDEYGRPISRRPPAYDPYYGGGYYYDEYGQPVRRREPEGAVYYDEYGRPIRRRPPQGYDPRREEAMRRKRAANGADPAKRRPDPTKAGQQTAPNAPARPGAAASGPKAPQPESRRTAAPVAMPSLKKDFDEERVAVSIPDFEDRDNSYENEQVTLRADRARPASTTPPAPPKPVVVDESEYSPRDMEAVPIVIPDDDYYSRYEDEEQAYVPPAASAARQQSGYSAPPARSAHDYSYDVDDVPPEEQDAGVVVVPDFSDYDESGYDDRYSRGRYRSGSPSGEREQAYQPPVSQSASSQKPQSAYSPEEEEDYSYEDEGVVVLPHDEGYESYLEKVKEEEEKKRIEERKQARKKSGKIALTIKKVRRRKIRRKSRRYKRFRASVIPLAKYLSSYDA